MIHIVNWRNIVIRQVKIVKLELHTLNMGHPAERLNWILGPGMSKSTQRQFGALLASSAQKSTAKLPHTNTSECGLVCSPKTLCTTQMHL